MADYQRMYLTLMRETEKAVRILLAAQQHCEALYLEAEDEPRPFPLPHTAKEDPSD